MKGVLFDNLHSYTDFRLLLTSKKIEVPATKTETIEVAGADGVLDLTDFFGEVKYSNRHLTFEFATNVDKNEFITLFSEIQNALHGKRMKIILDDDPDFYYIGRVSVNEWQADRNIGLVTISCDCEPYKYKLYKTILSVNVKDELEVIYTNLRKQVTPIFTSSGNVKIEFEGQSYSINQGTSTIPDIVFKAGKNIVKYTGVNISVTCEYQERGL